MNLDAVFTVPTTPAHGQSADGLSRPLRPSPCGSDVSEQAEVQLQDNDAVYPQAGDFKMALRKRLSQNVAEKDKKNSKTENPVELAQVVAVDLTSALPNACLTPVKAARPAAAVNDPQAYPKQTPNAVAPKVAAAVNPDKSKTQSAVNAPLSEATGKGAAEQPEAVPPKIAATTAKASENPFKPKTLTAQATELPKSNAAENKTNTPAISTPSKPDTAVVSIAHTENRSTWPQQAGLEPSAALSSAAAMKSFVRPIQHNAPEQTSTATPTDSSPKKGKQEVGKSLSSATSQSASSAVGKDASISETHSAVAPLEQLGRSFRAAEPMSALTAPAQAATVQAVGQAASVRPVDQIVQNFQLRTFGVEQEVRMTLAPQELGAIRLTFRQVDGEVVGLLEVQKNDTRRDIEQSLGQLTAAMENAGVQMRRIEVVPWTSGNQQQPQRSDAGNQGFDPAMHQQMHQSAEERAARYGSSRPNSGSSDTPPPSPSWTHDPSHAEQAGLNLFV